MVGFIVQGLRGLGVAGIWNDMNEPSVFVAPTGTMPLDVVHDNEGQPTTHREIHNVYGQLMSRATFEGLSRLRPNDRAFVLTRATFAGGQRYAAVWPGDNTADWTSLRQTIRTLLGMGVSGLSFVGSDIGGYAYGVSPELFTRWLQVGVFSPFMRVHAELGSPDKEPWSFGPRYEAINKRTIELRYQLLPYIYNVMQQAGETGVPAMRPLFLEYPNDEATAAIDDEFLLGSDLLVAPVLREGASERAVYLPKGDWYDYWTGRRSGGRCDHQRAGDTGHVSVVRARRRISFFDSRWFSIPAKCPANRSESSWRRPGNRLRNSTRTTGRAWTIARECFSNAASARPKRRSRHVEVSAPEGSYRPSPRDLIFEVWTDREPKAVSCPIGQ